MCIQIESVEDTACASLPQSGWPPCHSLSLRQNPTQNTHTQTHKQTKTNKLFFNTHIYIINHCLTIQRVS